MRKNFSDLTDKYNKYHFFYTGCFSNWHRSPFTDARTKVFYDCAEQYMMHRKAILFGDTDSADKIMAVRNNPAECKSLGRGVTGFDPETWDREARAIVYEGCYYKFSQNSNLLRQLVLTKGSLLVEASPVDTIWGIGMKSTDPGVNDPNCWRGTNWLGQVLTYLRDDLDS